MHKVRAVEEMASEAGNDVLEIRVISRIEEFKALGSAWNTILEGSLNNRVFLTHEWFMSWWQAFGDKKDLFILTLQRAGNTIAIVPLMKYVRTWRGIPVRLVEFMENNDSPGCSFISNESSDEVVDKIMSFLVVHRSDWDIVRFPNVRNIADVTQLSASLARLGHGNYVVTEGLRSPYLVINSDWDSYSQKSLSTRSRKTLRNVHNKITGLGDFSIAEHRSADNLADAETISRKAWKYAAGEAFINNIERHKFFRLLSVIAQDKGWLSIWCLYHGTQPIAYEYHLTYNNIDTALLAEFDADYASISPGAYLDSEVIRRLFSRQTLEYDLCGSEDAYKRKWTSNVREHSNITIFSGTIYGTCIFVLENRIVRFMKKVRDRLVRQ